jgi:hypothetical protein
MTFSPYARLQLIRTEVESERALGERVSDPVSWERRHTPDGGYPNALPPVPDPEMESRADRMQRLRQIDESQSERLDQIQRDLRILGRRRPAPTPPYTETDIAFMARRARLRRDPVTSSLTPARSPVRISPPGDEAEISTSLNSGPEELPADLDLAAENRELRDNVSTINLYPGWRYCVFSFNDL